MWMRLFHSFLNVLILTFPKIVTSMRACLLSCLEKGNSLDSCNVKDEMLRPQGVKKKAENCFLLQFFFQSAHSFLLLLFSKSALLNVTTPNTLWSVWFTHRLSSVLWIAPEAKSLRQWRLNLSQHGPSACTGIPVLCFCLWWNWMSKLRGTQSGSYSEKAWLKLWEEMNCKNCFLPICHHFPLNGIFSHLWPFCQFVFAQS